METEGIEKGWKSNRRQTTESANAPPETTSATITTRLTRLAEVSSSALHGYQCSTLKKRLGRASMNQVQGLKMLAQQG